LQKILITIAALALGFVGSVTSFASLANPIEVKADKDRIRAHIHFLADDLLEGREAGTRGFDIAARYVAGQFAQIGVAPRGNTSGPASYLQPVPLASSKLDQDSPVFEILRKSGVEQLTYLDDFTLSSGFSEDTTDRSTSGERLWCSCLGHQPACHRKRAHITLANTNAPLQRSVGRWGSSRCKHHCRKSHSRLRAHDVTSIGYR